MSGDISLVFLLCTTIIRHTIVSCQEVPGGADAGVGFGNREQSGKAGIGDGPRGETRVKAGVIGGVNSEGGFVGGVGGAVGVNQVKGVLDASVAAEIPAGTETIIENLGDLGLVSGGADFFLDEEARVMPW